MGLKYGDMVTLVKKSREGSIQRVNAIVLLSALHGPLGQDRRPLVVDGKALPAVEHLDLAFPDPGLVPAGQTLKTRNVELIFRLAYDVAEWNESLWIGFEVPAEPISADFVEALKSGLYNARGEGAGLRDQLSESESKVERLNAELEAVKQELANEETLRKESDDLITKLRAELEAVKQPVVGLVGGEPVGVAEPEREEPGPASD